MNAENLGIDRNKFDAQDLAILDINFDKLKEAIKEIEEHKKFGTFIPTGLIHSILEAKKHINKICKRNNQPEPYIIQDVLKDTNIDKLDDHQIELLKIYMFNLEHAKSEKARLSSIANNERQVEKANELFKDSQQEIDKILSANK